MSLAKSQERHALVLLPPVPYPSSYAAIKAAYHSSLLHSIRHITDPTTRVTLDIAVPCPHLYQTKASRSSLYEQTQTVVANVYKLICVIAAKQDIEVADVEEDGVLDARVILIAYPRDGVLLNKGDTHWYGPVIDLQTLAQSHRGWTTIFSVETEQGEQLLNNFKLSAEKIDAEIVKVRGGIIHVDQNSNNDSGHICQSVAVGGTFDHLHIGHKLLLTMVAFMLDPPVSKELQDQPEKVITIGMTAADLLAKKKYAEMLQSWRLRTDRTHRFMRGIMLFGQVSERLEEVHKPGPNGHAVLIHLSSPGGRIVIRYTEIWDPFGPTITDPDIDTLVVSGETRSGGQMVNDKRVEVKMKSLAVFEVDVLDTTEESSSEALSDNFQAKLSSTEIRKAQAERHKSRSKV